MSRLLLDLPKGYGPAGIHYDAVRLIRDEAGSEFDEDAE